MYDVVVIGAGLSGLTLARRLTSAGRDVVVLEARDRIGGRAYSPGFDGHPIDLGATWVWDSEHAIHALLQELGVETFPHHRDGLDTYEDHGVQRGRFPRSHVPERRVVGGVGRIVARLGESLDCIRLGEPVRSVRRRTDTIEVTTVQSTFSARTVVAALPPSLLAPLLDDTDLARWLVRVPVWMGDICKVIARFDHRFWIEEGWSGRGASRRGPMVEIHDLSGPNGDPAVLFGFVPAASDRPDLERQVRAQLVRMFGSRAVPTEVVLQRWYDEPFTVPSTVEPSDPRLFGHERLRGVFWEGALHLVGCETSGISPGHLNGAVERAESVARAIGSR